jgi:hypothetical protein
MYLEVIEEHCKDAEKVFGLLESQAPQDAIAIDAIQDRLFSAIENYFEEFEATVLLGRCAELENVNPELQSKYKRFLALPHALAVRLLQV